MAITKKRFYRRDERCPDIPRSATLALLGELQPLARQFFVAPFALLVRAVRGLPAFCRMGADAFGPHIEMAAQTERSRGAKKILVLTANGFLLWGLSWSEAGVAPADRRGQIGDFLMTFNEAIAQLELAAREHGLALENLLARLRAGAISKEQFVSEIRPLHEAFERIVEELTREAKNSALAAMASLKAPEPKAKN